MTSQTQWSWMISKRLWCYVSVLMIVMHWSCTPSSHHALVSVSGAALVMRLDFSSSHTRKQKQVLPPPIRVPQTLWRFIGIITNNIHPKHNFTDALILQTLAYWRNTQILSNNVVSVWCNWPQLLKNAETDFREALRRCTDSEESHQKAAVGFMFRLL